MKKGLTYNYLSLHVFILVGKKNEEKGKGKKKYTNNSTTLSSCHGDKGK